LPKPGLNKKEFAMLTDRVLSDRLQGLLELGECDTLRGPRDEWRDYVAEFDLTAGDIPELLVVLDYWFQWNGENDYPESPLFHAPIHAWRALGQLQALDAVEPMLANLNLLDDTMDDWSSEDWPTVFAQMGPPVIEPLTNYLRGQLNNEYARATTVDGLVQISVCHPDRRDQVVQILSDQLAKQEPEATLNGLILWKLLDLEAVETAEVIERAFAAEVIDDELCGSWTEVREKLGVEGLGIAPLRPRKPYGDAFFPQRFLFSDWDRPERQDDRRSKRKQEKAKRKAAEKSRKRNRREK
jgi:hypothetical protein